MTDMPPACFKSSWQRRIAATGLGILLSTGLPAAAAEQKNSALSPPEAVMMNVIPKPWKVEIKPGRFLLSPETHLVLDDHLIETTPVAAVLAEYLGRAGKLEPQSSATTAPVSTGSVIRLTLNDQSPDLGEEGYLLEISPQEVRLSGNTAAGLFYGVQTIKQLLVLDSDAVWSLPCLRLEDRPRFPWRGMLLDCGRRFMSKEFIKRTIDLLAGYKMNRFHWHLTEDQGWRIEIKKYPRLTEMGAWRVLEDGTRYGGFYTQEDIREVVAYAADRFVTVIPEVEMPGHCLAALASYPDLSCSGGPFDVQTLWGVHQEVFCAGNERTFAFLEDVLSEVLDLFPSPVIHIGGDEVPKDRWKACPRCQARIQVEGLKDENGLQSYFIQRIEKFLNSRGRRLIGWDEILEGGLAPNATVQSWQSFEGAVAAARSGHDTIVSPVTHAYFDFDLRRLDLRQVYAFDPVPRGLTAAEATHVLGGECNMWTEYAPQEKVDSKVFPRLLAMAEVLWSDLQARDFKEFRRRLQGHYPRLEALGVNYGAETRSLTISPNFQTDSGRLLAVIIPSEPGLDIRFTLDGSPPTLGSPAYSRPLEIHQSCTLKAAAFLDGRRYGEIEEREFRRHGALGRKLTLTSSYSPRYRAGGDQALADGIRGSALRQDGAWQGFEGCDLVATLDLGRTTDLRRLACGFLQHASIGIFLPDLVEFFVSRDGKSFTSAGTVITGLSRKNPELTAREIEVALDKVSARYVRVRARNVGPCPAGHPLAGLRSWIFADEIVIE
jgi:hexosaminidase